MDFNDAMEFIAAIIVLIVAGALLGAAIGRRRKQLPEIILRERLKAYADLLTTIDNIRDAEIIHKRRFILAYQRAVLYAPDNVMQSLDKLVQSAAADEYDPAATMEARDAAVLAIRQDALTSAGRHTGIKPSELLSIEIDTERPRPAVPPAPVAPSENFEEPA